jgi:2-methylisocitrate lyase-like PEP mutase family enzyme
MPTQSEKAEEFRKLHRGSGLLILPNAWDVPSARTFEDAGFPAIATTSAGLMVSLGYRDGQEMPKRELLRTIARIAERVSVPLSADIVAGYGRGPRSVAATVRSVIEAGAVGINLEDQDPTDHRLYPIAGQVRKLRAVREVASAAAVPLVINARTDAFRLAAGTPDDKLREAIRRATAYRDAGADCVYPMGLTEGPAIERFVRELACPVNVMVRRGLPSLAELERIGVKRVSFGPAASYATMGLLRRICDEVLRERSLTSLIEGAITHDELNQLATPREPRSDADSAEPRPS